MSAAQVGLVFVIGLPLAVIVAMIFWPSGYDECDGPSPDLPDHHVGWPILYQPSQSRWADAWLMLWHNMIGGSNRARVGGSGNGSG
ncbi:hypothetical protein AB0L63_24760 [Nocardia sp. NPDC051990]|uniref:hypothetical protein n=1 Tax=Nocardia sp. NPDC051990 TaxID=3155285 RepID=UPI003442422B